MKRRCGLFGKKVGDYTAGEHRVLLGRGLFCCREMVLPGGDVVLQGGEEMLYFREGDRETDMEGEMYCCREEGLVF